MTLQEAIRYVNYVAFGYTFEKSILMGVAINNHVIDYEKGFVPPEVRDYCRIEICEGVFHGAYSKASYSQQQGDSKRTVGGDIVTPKDKRIVAKELEMLYAKYGMKEKSEMLRKTIGGLRVLNESTYDV